MDKIRLPTILLALLLLTTPAHAQISRDKYTHAGVCYAIEYTLKDAKPFNRWKPWQRALFVTGVIGGGKEWYDARHPDRHSADWGDIAADAVGACTAEGVVWLYRKTW
jgi:uncharacterized protein YfiM (DUF2279 family)